MKCRWPNSLMSANFVQVQPRLQDLQDLLRQLFFDENFKPTSHANHTFDLDLLDFDILIGVWSQSQMIIGPVDLTQETSHVVSDLLCLEFSEIMVQTIDPSLLALDVTRNNTDADHDDSTTLYGDDNQHIFSNQFESENTDTTYSPPDAPDLAVSQLESTANLGVKPSIEDFASIGAHVN